MPDENPPRAQTDPCLSMDLAPSGAVDTLQLGPIMTRSVKLEYAHDIAARLWKPVSAWSKAIILVTRARSQGLLYLNTLDRRGDKR